VGTEKKLQNLMVKLSDRLQIMAEDLAELTRLSRFLATDMVTTIMTKDECEKEVDRLFAKYMKESDEHEKD